MDVYSTEKLTGSGESIGEYLGEFISNMFGSSDSNPNFVADDKWYDGDDAEIAAAIKTRFVGYLSGGNETEADDFLKKVNVVDGLNGLDFSDSYVNDDTLYIVLKYKLQYNFNIWDVGEVDVEQTTSSKLWK